jgi:hypothetical protein
VLRPGEVTPNDLERAISGSSVARVHCASLAKATAASHSLIRPSISSKARAGIWQQRLTHCGSLVMPVGIFILEGKALMRSYRF